MLRSKGIICTGCAVPWTAFIKGQIMLHRKLTEVKEIQKYRSNSMRRLIISMFLDLACTLHPSYCSC